MVRPSGAGSERARYGILVCQALRREVMAVVAAAGLDDARVIVFPSHCGQPARQRKALDRILQTCEDGFDHLLVLGGSCLQNADRLAAPREDGRLTVLPGCFELFLPAPLVQRYLREGAYLLTPGWLESWRRRLADWRFDPPTARAFFAESCSRLLLLDTGVDPRGREHLREMAAFVDRPHEVVPVGLDLLEAVLARQVWEWRAAARTVAPAPATPAPETQLADYAAVFDLMGRLTGFETEDKVYRAFFDLFEMMCAPAVMAFLPVSDGQPGQMLTFPPASATDEALWQHLADLREQYAWTESGAGFVVRIARGPEVMGVLWVDRIALPQHRERYLNFALAVLPVLALAISNARNFERLERAKELHRLTRFTVERVAEAVFWILPDARIVDVNEAACQCLGYSRAELLALTVPEIDSQYSAAVWPQHWEELQRRGSMTFESEHCAKDGRRVPVEITANHIRFDRREFNCALVRDITERKRQEEELQRKNTELERFAYLISHDLKSPLVTIKIFLGYLAQDLARSDAGRIERDLGYMGAAADKMGQLLNDLLEFSRVGRAAHPPVRLSLRQLADEALRLVAGGIAQRGVEVRVSDMAVTLVGDAPRLVDLWQNLVENAVKYLGDQPAPRIEIGAERHGRETRFFVRDNGMGIDPRYQDKVFGLFEKLDANSEGTGLGLALVKRIVELYQGAIWLESPGLGQGACVWFTLPGAVEDQRQKEQTR